MKNFFLMSLLFLVVIGLGTFAIPIFAELESVAFDAPKNPVINEYFDVIITANGVPTNEKFDEFAVIISIEEKETKKILDSFPDALYLGDNKRTFLLKNFPSIEYYKEGHPYLLKVEHRDGIFTHEFLPKIAVAATVIPTKDMIANMIDYEIIQWNDFEYEFNNAAEIFTENLKALSILETGKKYFVIHKADFTDDNFAENSKFDVVLGYAFQPGDKMITPPRGANTTDAEHQEFAGKIQELNQNFYQESDISQSLEFTVDPTIPFYVKSTLAIKDPGQYTHQYYEKLKFSPSVMSSNMGGLVVVDKFSKAVGEDGVCKNEELLRVIKHDYSTIVCVDSTNVFKLKERGWALN